MILSALKHQSYNMNPTHEGTFKSYLDETVLENISLNDKQKTSLLEGETVVHEAQKVLLLAPLSDVDIRSALIGVLTVTTFKLSFANTNSDQEPNGHQNNLLLKPNEICLSAIESVYQMGDKSKKKLAPGQNVTGKIKELLIVCKNMKTMSFNFKHCDKDSGKQIANALLHHAFPKRANLLFAYEYKHEPQHSRESKDKFISRDDWERELKRTQCPNWRVSDVNANYNVSVHLPEYVVVPKDITNDDIYKGAQVFRNTSFPIWVWGNESAALVRMPEVLPSVTNRSHENTFLAKIHKCHPEKTEPEIFELLRDCPTPRDIQGSYIKLRNLCVPDSTRLFKLQDYKFYGLLDACKWLHHVSACLSKARDAADLLEQRKTVVLQEDRGADLNCVVSSLTQLILDAHWRTMRGFQALVQKEWVSLAHPFQFRLGHILNDDVEPAYVFLLFLDCVWQLLRQHPEAFQFSETYLTTVWDSAHVNIFDTFLFNNQHDRQNAYRGDNLIPRSVWDWSEQFAEHDVVLFRNPLYDKSARARLRPQTGASALDVWRQCYFRWLPDLEIRNGGQPQVDMCNRFIAEEIDLLRLQLSDQRTNGAAGQSKTDQLACLSAVHSFYPFSQSGRAGGAATNNFHDELLFGNDAFDTQSILNLTND